MLNEASAEELLHLLIGQTKELAVVLVDLDGRIRWWNPGAQHIFGVNDDEIRGKLVTTLFPVEEIENGLAGHEITVARTHGVAEDDRWMARRDGSRFWASGVMLALRNEKGELVGFGKILRNRTDLREQLDTLKNQVTALDAASQQKDIFLTTLSHELRNPLSPIGYAVQLIRRTADVTPELDSHLAVIERQADALRRMVNDLVDVARLGAGKVEVRKEPISVNEVIHRSVESIAPIVREKRHQLDVLFPPTPIVVEGDPDRLQQVFVNLLNNAVKYTPEDGRIWVEGTTEGNEAVIDVADTGIGIPNELLPQIFELFTQAHASRKHGDGGLGIGLSLVKDLVTLHGGSVQVRSEGEGKGSEFTVRLPLVRPVTSGA